MDQWDAGGDAEVFYLHAAATVPHAAHSSIGRCRDRVAFFLRVPRKGLGFGLMIHT